MIYELYRFELEVRRSDNRALFDAVKNNSTDAFSLINEEVRNADGYKLFYATPELFDDLDEAVNKLETTTYEYVSWNVPFINVKGSVIVHMDEEKDDIIDYTFSEVQTTVLEVNNHGSNIDVYNDDSILTFYHDNLTEFTLEENMYDIKEQIVEEFGNDIENWESLIFQLNVMISSHSSELREE